jgi:ribose 5-phosphate isomerase A
VNANPRRITLADGTVLETRDSHVARLVDATRICWRNENSRARQDDNMKVFERALDFVKDGDRVGLGTGHAASAFVHALAARVRTGLSIQAVATSEATTAQAVELGIALTSLEQVEGLDVMFDGADEVDPNIDLIKGYGGALVRERVVAAASNRLIILVGSEKLVPVLGSRGRLPVEVVPFALPLCRRRLEALGLPALPRARAGGLLLSDNGNALLDCAVGPIASPRELAAEINSIPGVVGTGLFLGLADVVLVQSDDDVVVLSRSGVNAPPQSPVQSG